MNPKRHIVYGIEFFLLTSWWVRIYVVFRWINVARYYCIGTTVADVRLADGCAYRLHEAEILGGKCDTKFRAESATKWWKSAVNSVRYFQSWVTGMANIAHVLDTVFGPFRPNSDRAKTDRRGHCWLCKFASSGEQLKGFEIYRISAEIRSPGGGSPWKVTILNSVAGIYAHLTLYLSQKPCYLEFFFFF